ncbi:MAG: LysM peptidoglycan-binding domain-containing protein [Candidatus Accumulibacter sp.]|nr:LysM peptidoglycan-binding domain-containing protein [Accumulibacter sp.]
MIRILSLLVLAAFSHLCAGLATAAEEAPNPAEAAARPAEPPKLAETAPNRYTVVSGDTLWDISAKFLQEPWRWPEIWRLNQAQIKNPHRIYPGDVIVLDRDADGKPYLRLESKRGGARAGNAGHDDSRRSPRVLEELLSDVIPPIPPNVIEPFIATPLFVDQDALRLAPRVVATQEDRVFLGNGDTAYVEGADSTQKIWQVFRSGKPLYDPERPGQVLGYEVFHLGSATQITPGDVAVFEIDTAKQEIGIGDLLVPSTRPELIDYVPHPPDYRIDGRVVSIYGGIDRGRKDDSRKLSNVSSYSSRGSDLELSTDTGGRLSIIAINRGNGDGLEVGHVLALERNRVSEHRDENDRLNIVIIPPLRFGLVFVFRTFEHVSYALAVQADYPIKINDFIRTP